MSKLSVRYYFVSAQYLEKYRDTEKMMCNNPKLDLVNMNASIKFGENMSVSSQDIEQKLHFDIN